MKITDLHVHPESDETIDIKFSRVMILMGPNGAGKTTIMRSIERKYRDESSEGDPKYRVVFDNPQDFMSGRHYNDAFDISRLGKKWTSEGEQISWRLNEIIEKCGFYVHQSKSKVIVLLDRVDSGLSIDSIKGLADFIKDFLMKNAHVLISANSYELASQFKDVAKFYWVPERKEIELGSYEDFVKLYIKD